MGSLSTLNLTVIIVVLIAITVIGQRFAGRATSSQSFFTADGGLPWWAVSASLYATAISSISFISIPGSVFRPGGNLELLQIELGQAVGKILIAIVFVRAYYESKGVNTVYDYLDARLGTFVSRSTMLITILLTIALNSIVVVSAALVLNVLTDLSTELSCLAILGLSILWCWAGGLRTVIWTDLMMFCTFFFGALLALGMTISAGGMDIAAMYELLDRQSKLKLLELTTDPSRSYTLWTGIFCATLLGMTLITSQSGMQRVKACRSVGDAQKAYAYCVVFYVVTITLMGVGLGLTAYYEAVGIPPELSERLRAQPDQVFPFFIVTQIPDGYSGVLVAAILAAAISTLNSRLAELADITVSNVYRPFLVKGRQESHYLKASRMFIVVWGALYGAAAIALSRIDGQNLLEATYFVANVATGPILAVFFLARYGVGGTSSVILGTALAVIASLWLRQRGVSDFWSTPISVVLMFAAGWIQTPRRLDRLGIVAATQIEHPARAERSLR